jgi:SNF2 family DNA or RNA helicase
MFKLLNTTKLEPHQERYVQFQLSKKTVGNFDKPGLGKSLETIAAAVEVKARTLVICPSHLVSNWHGEFQKFTEMEKDKEYYIVPYTMVSKRLADIKDFDFVICDESHFLKNMEAQRTAAVHHLLYKNPPKYYAALSGTPVMNRLPDIYSFLVSLCYFPHTTPRIEDKYPTYYQFCTRFCNVTEKRFGGRSVMQFTGAKNLEELATYLKPWTICRTTDQVTSLPAMENQTVRAGYKDDPTLEKEWAAFLEGAKYSPTAKKESAKLKARFTAEYVHTELESNSGPIVVFSDHPDAVYTIEQELSDKWRVKSITGETDVDRRAEYVQQFQRGQLDALCLTIGSSSTGITLTKSNFIVFNDICWTPEDLSQARKRVDRMTQTRTTRCVYVVGSPIDERIIKNVTSKLATINKLNNVYGG